MKIDKVDKSPLHPNTLLGNVIEVENGCESCKPNLEFLNYCFDCTKQSSNYCRHECITYRHN